MVATTGGFADHCLSSTWGKAWRSIAIWHLLNMRQAIKWSVVYFHRILVQIWGQWVVSLCTVSSLSGNTIQCFLYKSAQDGLCVLAPSTKEYFGPSTFSVRKEERFSLSPNQMCPFGSSMEPNGVWSTKDLLRKIKGRERAPLWWRDACGRRRRWKEDWKEESQTVAQLWDSLSQPNGELWCKDGPLSSLILSRNDSSSLPCDAIDRKLLGNSMASAQMLQWILKALHPDTVSWLTNTCVITVLCLGRRSI